MLCVADAHSRILAECSPLAAIADSPTLGAILAEDILADLDSPPFDKALMDGYAVRAADEGPRQILEEITAGRVPTLPIGTGQASRIMTGAPIPQGADAVIMREATREESDLVHLLSPVAQGKNILRQGAEMRVGECVVARGSRIRPQEIGVLATLGKGRVLLHPAPRVAVFSTGDELVDVDRIPGPGQIRNSNAHMLTAQVRRAGGRLTQTGIIRDSLDELRTHLSLALKECEVLILSGGVSAGKLDLVPQALSELGVEAIFHKVSLKPGKPLLFGVRHRDPQSQQKQLIFGLPGNPVSSFVCFELFVGPALRRLAGHTQVDLSAVQATLSEPVRHDSDRPTYHPAALEGASVRLVPWLGSADLRAFLGANALAVLPAGSLSYAAGDWVQVLKLE
jgi:molybdopterin molybdotransferase